MKLGPRWHRLRYYGSEAWDECRRSPGVNLLALGTLAAVLFVAGLVGLVLSNVERWVGSLGTELHVDVYLRDALADGERATLQRELAGLNGVERVRYVSREEALQSYRDWNPRLAVLADELEGNPLPASFEVYLVPGSTAEATAATLAARLRERQGVEEVRFDSELIQRMEALLGLARLGSSGMAVLVFAAVVFVMASVLRLAVYNRRDEIEIMLLVGAPPGFVRGPFLVAGAIQGCLAALLALGTVELVRRGSLVGARATPAVLLELLAARALPPERAALLLLVGLVVGLAGSWFAVRRSL